MKRIETSLQNVVADITAFYKSDVHHYVAMNGVDLGDKMEIQWFFCDYAYPSEVTMFNAFCGYEETIPSLCKLIPAAWCTEVELVDLMDIKIEGAEKGFVLDQDSIQSPLRKNK